jgi:DUF4097 and DUF4098 domain-containing protein YvlB
MLRVMPNPRTRRQLPSLRAGIAVLAGWRRRAILTIAAGACLGCQTPATGGGAPSARATEQWTRSYPAASLREVEVANTNGSITVDGIDGSAVDVVAERVAQAANDEAARDLLTHIHVTENVSPDKVKIETDRIGGVMIRATAQVNYRIRVPTSLAVRVRTGTGNITLSAISGRVVASTANGHISAKAIGGGIEARTVNQNISADLARLGADPVDLRTTNGDIEARLPSGARGTLLATTVSGVISVAGLRFQAVGEQTSRRVRGEVNGGGTRIELNAVRGNITVRSAE